MKRISYIILALVLMLPSVAVSAQDVYTKVCTDKKLVKKAKKWNKKGEWRKGFDKAAPHSSVNLAEFYTQYEKNTAQWDAMFRWLSTHDLLTIEKGKYPIEGTTLTVSVEDSKNEPLAKRGSESHYEHIDFQWVVKGTERFGILEHNSSKENCKYKPDVMHYDYDAQKAKFEEPDNEHFMLFFPDDWHIAKVATDKEDQTIRVIVVKLDYVK